MATLSSQAFMPSGAFDSDMSLALHRSRFGNPSSIPPIPSPPSSNALPRSRSHYSRIVENSNASNSSNINNISSLSTIPRLSKGASPLSLASLREACASQPNSLPPHLQFESTTNYSISRPSNPASNSTSNLPSGLPPSRPSRASDWSASTITNPNPSLFSQLPSSSYNRPRPHIPPGIAAESLSRSISADAVGPSQTSLHIIQRLTQQNALIRDAWEAERSHLEANRRRAEQVYQEERAIMEDVKQSWEDEKAALLQEIQTLKERTHRLEGENSTLKAVASQRIQLHGVISPLASQRGGSASTDTSSLTQSFTQPLSRVTSRSHGSMIPQSFSMADLPPGLDGASRRPHFLSPGSSRVSPTTQPDAYPFVPLDPRTQPENSVPTDFLASAEESEMPIPVIDVQEIDPKLEGIPIKANAIQKSTFGLVGSPPPSEASQRSSRATSPTADSNRTDQSRPRGMTREHTLQALVAPESRRLTMHAGHTPNHSLSLFPTVTSTEAGTSEGHSEGATPTAEMPSGFLGDAVDGRGKDAKGKAVDRSIHPHPGDSAVGGESFGELEPEFEPDDDVPLKFPLMIRNMPAQDEIFWEAVNKKLEPISQGQNALPTVVQTTLRASESSAGPSAVDVLPRVGTVGGDGPHDTHASADTDEEDTDTETGTKSADADVPLKFKSTSNFGAPFGSM